MIKCLLAALLLMFVSTAAIAGDGTGPVHVSSGTIVDLGVLKSKYADPRRVVVWLPDGYSPRGPKYAVLYMHDGQNLFDKATAGYGNFPSAEVLKPPGPDITRFDMADVERFVSGCAMNFPSHTQALERLKEPT